jgi:hypothetical protein
MESSDAIGAARTCAFDPQSSCPAQAGHPVRRGGRGDSMCRRLLDRPVKPGDDSDDVARREWLQREPSAYPHTPAMLALATPLPLGRRENR